MSGGPVAGVTPGSSSKPPSSSDVVSLEAAVSSSLPLSQTSSEIWLGDNLHFLDAPLMTVHQAKVASPDLRAQPVN